MGCAFRSFFDFLNEEGETRLEHLNKRKPNLLFFWFLLPFVLYTGYAVGKLGGESVSIENVREMLIYSLTHPWPPEFTLLTVKAILLFLILWGFAVIWYPEPESWYELVIREAFHRDGRPWFRGVWIDGKAVVNPWVQQKETGAEEAAVTLCALLTTAAEEAMEKVRKGTYNNEVNAFLPDHFHAEVMKKSTDVETLAWTGGTKIQNLRIRGKYAFQRGMLTRSANYNILCRWLTERLII